MLHKENETENVLLTFCCGRRNYILFVTTVPIKPPPVQEPFLICLYGSRATQGAFDLRQRAPCYQNRKGNQYYSSLFCLWPVRRDVTVRMTFLPLYLGLPISVLPLLPPAQVRYPVATWIQPFYFVKLLVFNYKIDQMTGEKEVIPQNPMR